MITLEPVLPTYAYDWTTYLDWLRNPENARYIESRWWLGGVESLKKSVGHTWENGGWLWSIEVDDVSVGIVKLDPWGNRAHGVYWIGILIGSPEHQGNGYATAAVQQACAHGFKMGARIILAGIYEPNEASMALFTKCGFGYGCCIEGGRMFEGTPVDHFIMRLDPP